MGLWDILVPSEPGVLHNLIANPSFEYDNNELDIITLVPPSGTIIDTQIQSYRTLPANTGLVYWSSVSGASIQRSSAWASRGGYSLKIAAGATTNAGTAYDPTSARPSMAGVTITVTQEASSNPTWDKIPSGKSFFVAVVGLTDTGVSLLNGLADTQVYQGTNVSDKLPYLTLDALRGHTAPKYAALTGLTSGSTSIKVSVSDTNTADYTVRAWAVFYSTDSTLTKTYTLAAVTPAKPAVAIAPGVTEVYIHTIIDTAIATTINRIPQQPTLATGKVYMFPWAVNGQKILKGVGTKFLQECPENTDIYTVDSAGSKIFLGRVATSLTYTTTGVDKITVSSTSSTAFTVVGTPDANSLVGRAIYTTGGTFVGIVATASSSSAGNFEQNAAVTVANLNYKWTDATQTQVLLENNATQTPIGEPFYYAFETNPQTFPGNNVGAISTFTSDVSTLPPTVLPLSMGLDCTTPYFGITNNAYGGFTKKHHLYLDWYMSSPNTVNPNATYTDTGKNWSVYLYNNTTATGTLVGTLDDSTVTSANAHRMMLRKKFLIPRPSGDTSNMSIRILYTGTTSDADLYIDGVQFVDVGMVWRAYDWYTASPSSYTTPYQFSDWDWDDVEFSYIDGDRPGAIWSDTMPLQTGTYTGSFPYFTTNGVWHQNVDEYTAVQDMGGYGSPAFREQRQWRNEGKPIYGVSVPGLSQSAMLTQSFETGFWAPLNTSNINVVVEPTVSGPGMPEIATTSLEYGITDGGFVQRQIARMRNMQLNVTISADSWTGLHANRRSLINLLKFDQLAQQGERMLRYRGADTPIITRITYISGLEYSGVNNQSFTETLGLRFLSTDPYFYVETPLSTDVSPTSLPNEVATVYYKLGRSSEWTPLSYHETQTFNASNFTNTNGTSTVYRSGNPFFYTSTGGNSIPKAIGWLQSPSGNVSTLVVGGDFSYPFSTLAFFYISGFSSEQQTTAKNVRFANAGGTITTGLNSTTVTVAGASVSNEHINRFLFISTDIYLGKITGVNTGANTYTIDNNLHPAYTTVQYVFVIILVGDVDANPLQVSGRQLFQMTGGSSAVNASVNAIYQESGSSIIVVGDFYQVIDLGSRQPDFNLNITSGTVANGFVSSSTISSGATSNPFFRIARFVMNDNGRIVVYPIDSQFTYDNTTASFRSVLYNQIFNQTINAVTKSPSGYVFAGTDVNGSINEFDNTASDSFAPLPVYRSSNAFGSSNYQSNVTSINPEISIANTSGTEQYTGFVGFRLGSQRFGTITTYPNGNGIMPFIAIANPINTRQVGRILTSADVGKLLMNLLGVYIGQIYYVFNPSGKRYSIAYLTQPAQLATTNAAFVLSASVTSITTDKKAINANIFAALQSNEDNQYRTSVHAYIANPQIVGRISTVAGSNSIGYVGDATLTETLGTNAKTSNGYDPLATVTTNDDTVLGWNTNFTSNMIGNFILTPTGLFVGKIKTISSPTKLILTKKAENALGTGTTKLTISTGTITINPLTPTKVQLNGLTIPTSPANQRKNFYVYQYIQNTNTANYIGQVNTNTATELTLYAASQITEVTTSQFILQATAIYVPFNMRSQKLFVNDDGYIAKSSYIQDSDNNANWHANTVLPATSTTSTSKHLAFANNAWAMYADTQSNKALMNLTGNFITPQGGVVRRSFYGDTFNNTPTATQQTAYDPSESSALIPSYANVYASYAFGTVAPYMDPAWVRAGLTWTLSGTSFTTTTSAGFAGGDEGKLIYITINSRIFLAGKISSVGSATSVTLAVNYAGTFTSVVGSFYLVPDGTNAPYGVTGGDYLASNNAGLVRTPFYIKKISAINFETVDTSGVSLSNVMSSKDIGRSIYLYNGGTPIFIGVIKGYSSPNFSVTVDVTNTPVFSIVGTVYPAMLSGGAPGVPPNGTGGNASYATWYPFQFAFSKGGQAGYYEYSNVNTGMMFRSFATMTSLGVLQINLVFSENVLGSPPPTSLITNDYSVYGYINSISVQVEPTSYSPTLIGQWKYLGPLNSTNSLPWIKYDAFASGTGNTIAATSGQKTVTVAGSPNAVGLVGTTIWTSGGVFVGNVISADGDTTAGLDVAFAGPTFAATTYYFTYTMTYNGNEGEKIGTPLCIVKNTTIYTDSPVSYAVDDELFAYADAYVLSTPSLQYVGTIQKIVGTPVSNSVTVSYMPYFGSAASPLNSTNIYQSNPFATPYGKSTILRSTKALRGSPKANYFGNVLGKFETAEINPTNSQQFSYLTLAEISNVNIPNIYQTTENSTTNFTFNTSTNQGSFNEADGGSFVNYLSNVTQGSTAITVTGVAPYPTALAGLQNRAIFRYDGAYIGVVRNDSSALVANAVNGGPSELFGRFPYLYTNSSNGASGTTTGGSITVAQGSKQVTYSAGTISAATLQGKALWNSTTGDFIGIVSYAFTTGASLVLSEPSPVAATSAPFAYANSTAPNTINASGTTTVTVTGYLPKSTPALSSLDEMGLFRKNTLGASPYIEWVGYVTSVAQTLATNTATLINTTGTFPTIGAESYIAAAGSLTGRVSRTNATTLSFTVVAPVVGLSVWRYIFNATGPAYVSAVFVGVVQSFTGTASPWTATILSNAATFTGAIEYLTGMGNGVVSSTTPAGSLQGTITTTAGSRIFTTSGTPLASAHVGRALFSNTGIYLGTCVGFNASSTSTGYFEENATTTVTSSYYNWMLATYNPTITTTQIATTSGFNFIQATASSTTVNVYGQPDGYALVNKTLYTSGGTSIGTVISAVNANTVTLASPGASVGTGGWANYQYGTASTMLTDAGNTLISNTGSTAITVAGYPTAYELVGRTVYTENGALIGTVSHATSNTAGVLRANAANPQTSAARYQIGYAHSITPFATLNNGATNTFAFASGAQTASGLFAYNGKYMGAVGSTPSISSFNFANMPYENTVGASSNAFIFMPATAPTTDSSMHVGYRHITSSSAFFTEGSKSGTIDCFPNASQLVGSRLFTTGTEIGVIASYNGGNSVTLAENSLSTTLGNDIWYNPTPSSVVFSGARTAASNDSSVIRDKFLGYIFIVESSQNNVLGTITTSNTALYTWSATFYGDLPYSPYTFTANKMKYFVIPGDVLRNTSNQIIGQVYSVNYQAKTIQLADNAFVANSTSIKIHHKHAYSEFIGLLPGTVETKLTVTWTGVGVMALVSATNSFFSSIPVDYLNKNNDLGTAFYVYNPAQNIANRPVWQKVGVIYQILSNTQLLITPDQFTMSDFSGQLFVGGISVRSMQGIGQINITATGMAHSVASISSTLLNGQAYSGAVITPFTSNNTSIGSYRFVDGISDVNAFITELNGSPYVQGLQSNMFFNIDYLYDESPVFDAGENVYINNDWQTLGTTNNPVLDITTTQNGSIVASGSFTQWADASDTAQDSPRAVGRIARIVPLITEGSVTDSYAAPIVGSSYANNGFDNTVYAARDVTEINPINGYVGSSDRLFIGGDFVKTLNGENVSPGLAYVEGSTIAGNLQHITNADVSFPSSAAIYDIAATNRLRQYSSAINTNYLDGINGTSVAIITSATGVNSKMQYYSIRVRGNASSYPTITIRNDSSARKLYELYQTETGARVVFANDGLDVLVYETITINFQPGNRNVTSNIRGNLIAYIDPTSNFVDWVLLGANNSAGKSTQSYDDYRLNVIGIHAQTQLTVTISYTPRFWSFDASNMFFGSTKAGL